MLVVQMLTTVRSNVSSTKEASLSESGSLMIHLIAYIFAKFVLDVKMVSCPFEASKVVKGAVTEACTSHSLFSVFLKLYE